MGLVLKRMLEDCGISLSTFGAAVKRDNGSGYAKSTMSIVLSTGDLPKRDRAFKKKVQKAFGKVTCVQDWLKAHKKKFDYLWEKEDGGGEAGIDIEHLAQEVVMLTAQARKHFELLETADPFRKEIRGAADIFMSEELKYMFYSMREVALDSGFMAVIGEVGSGKSIARKWLEEELRKQDDVKVIMPRAFDKRSLTAASICDSIIYDLSTAQPKSGPEKKARQVQDLLLSRSREGVRVVLIVEEAQDLNLRAFKILKRLYEVEDGFKKCLGIVLIGQPELGHLLDDREHPEMREVIRRCEKANIQGLNGSLSDYVDFKFKRAGLDRERYIEDSAIRELHERLIVKTGGREVSNAQPLTVNNSLAFAMNYAAEMGYEKVNAEVIRSL
jgi:type II secretory pathway predicted ATPase ExeA